MIQYTKLTAYAHPSTYSGFEDSHTFVLASTGEEFSNCGGIYTSDITKVAEGLAYRTWLNEFMPNATTRFKESGIKFPHNGVCHTYAMRELLFCINDKDTALAEGDNLCLLYYGKYGIGLKYLEKRLRETFSKASQKDNIPTTVLDKVINRIYNTLDEEEEAWINALKKYVDIDVLSYFRNSNDWEYLRNRIKSLADAREALFDQCCDYSSGTLSGDFSGKLKKLILDQFKQYIFFLADCGYFTQKKAEEIYAKFEAVVNAHKAHYMAMLHQSECL